VLGVGVEGGFYRTRALASAYLSAGRGPVLALRAGGEAAGGEFPLQYAAQLGGSRSIRGYETARFAGDRAAFGSAELRTVLMRANLGVRGDLGALAFVDAGRVWYGGESEGDLHTATGGGLFFRFQTLSASAFYARGERGRVYLRLGLPF
jgi:hemolysin activation/secretion protein